MSPWKVHENLTCWTGLAHASCAGIMTGRSGIAGLITVMLAGVGGTPLNSCSTEPLALTSAPEIAGAGLAEAHATSRPRRRLPLSSTFAFRHAPTHTDANNTPAVVPCIGNIYALMLHRTDALTNQTELLAEAGLGGGTDFRAPAVFATLEWRLP